MAWHKLPGTPGKLFPNENLVRKWVGVKYRLPLALRSRIHSHTPDRTWFRTKVPGVPASHDLKESLKVWLAGKKIAEHIAAIDKKGKVIGYYSYMPTRKFFASKEAMRLARRLLEDSSRVDANAVLVALIESDCLREQVREFPGYKLEHGYFVKSKKNKKSARKVKKI